MTGKALKDAIELRTQLSSLKMHFWRRGCRFAELQQQARTVLHKAILDGNPTAEMQNRVDRLDYLRIRAYQLHRVYATKQSAVHADICAA